MTRIHRLRLTELRLRLILAVAGVHAVLMSLFVWDITQRQRAIILGRQATQAEAASQALALSAAGWFAEHDLASLQELIEAQRLYPELEFAMLLDTEGRILAHTDRSRIGQSATDLPTQSVHTVVSRSPRMVDVASPIIHDGQPLGWVRIGVGQHEAGAELAQITHRGMLYAAVAIGLGVVLACILGTRITTRLYAIRAVASSVRRGDKSARVAVAGNDEVAQLATDFNDMLESLQLKEREFGQLNAELEQRVLLRTKELQDAVELNAQLIANATLGINVFEAAGRCIIANEAASRSVGGSCAQMLRQNFREIASWKRSGLFAAAEQVLATGVPQHRSFRLFTSYGREITVDGGLSRFVARGIPHLLFTFVDITEQEQLAARRAQLSSIIEHTSDFVATATPDGTVRYVNEAARRMFGLGAQDDCTTCSIAKAHSPTVFKLIIGEGLPFAAQHGSWTGETALLDSTGREIPHTQVVIAHKDDSGAVVLYSTICRDISARKHSEAIANARLHLLQSAPGLSTDAFLQFALDEIEARTSSTIGFFHYLGEDQETLSLQAWSTNTIRHMCTAEGKGRHYPISKAGIWADCVRRREPVIHNDYAAHAGKHGLPDGHAPIRRELTMPILRGERIVAILGVGNKPTDYEPRDAETVSTLADIAWEVIAPRNAWPRARPVSANSSPPSARASPCTRSSPTTPAPPSTSATST